MIENITGDGTWVGCSSSVLLTQENFWMDYKCGCWETSQQGPALGHGASQPWQGENPKFPPSKRGKTSLRVFFSPRVAVVTGMSHLGWFVLSRPTQPAWFGQS